MDRDFGIGDIVLCTDSGVVGTVLNFYTPTTCEEQTKVLTDDGRKYHAPTYTWVKYAEGSSDIVKGLLAGSDFDGVVEIPIDMARPGEKNVFVLPDKISQALIDDIKEVLNKHYGKAIYGGER